jgi:hypothetical protein
MVEPPAWQRLDRVLSGNKYMRFSLESTRNWDDATKRQWHAVAFMENGKVVARARRATRDDALAAMVDELERRAADGQK